MGNCIGKKSVAKHKHSSSTIHTKTKLYYNDQSSTKSTLLSSSPSSAAATEQTSIPPVLIFDVKEIDILFNNADESEEHIVQYSSSSLVPSNTTTNEQFTYTHTPPTLSPDQLSFQCKKFKSSNTVINFNENNLTQSITLVTNEQDLTMGHLFSKENEINNDQEVPIFTEEIIPDSFHTSPSPTFSVSSISYNTTSFSSQDQLILPSSSSSSSIVSIDNKLTYSEKIYLNNQSSNELFSILLPASSSRCHKDLFFNEFHQNIISHNCQILSSVIDDVVKQQCIRIHQRSRRILIEHKQLECINLKDVKKFDTPLLIFDEDQKVVHITKYTRFNELQSITCTTNNIINLPEMFSSCDHCSSLLSGTKLNHRLRPFFLVNTTYNLVQMCLNEINHKKNIFGYISQIDSNQIRQTIINNAKLSYSYDLDVDYRDFYFVLRVQSWPEDIHSTYRQRQRLWPSNIEQLFHNTCFIRVNNDKHETSIINQCPNCEKILSSSFDSSWSYTYTSIEAQLVLIMSNEHIRFASIMWNYLNGKTKGQLPFVIFKHTLFYFFEQYSFDSFITSDLLSYAHYFTDFLFNRFQTKSIPHYFNSNYNLYNDNISMTLINSIPIKMKYLDLKNFSIYLLPKTSLYLYRFIYLIQFQSNFLDYLFSLKANSIQTILDIHELVIKQLLLGIQTYKRQLDSIITIKSHRLLTLDCLYRYQEENVQIILDYLPLLREKEPSLIIHSIWSMFIQYFNCLFDDLFIS